jgi:2',3'-cyclic-nucleotide 2'-phosphodiesterase (5'-nucleotidase family)
MKPKSVAYFLLIVLFCLTACAKQQYGIKSVTGYLVEMNSSLDDHADPEMQSLVGFYKTRLDAGMNEVIGETARALTKTGQQSVLANFTADAMQEYATELWGTVDFAIINNGGLRTTLNQGPVTLSNMYEIYAFENNLVLLELPGKAVKQLFDDFAKRKMEGFSENLRLTLQNQSVTSISIGGKPLDETATYRVATVDYLAEGNDGMEALKQATGFIDSNLTLRDVMIIYVRKLTAENKIIDVTPDDRIENKE